MLYSDIRRETLGHIKRYSIAGTPIPASYNHQADDLNRISDLINEGVLLVRSTVKPESVVCTLTEGEAVGELLRYTLPEDFYSLCSGGVSVVRSGCFEKTNDYRLQGTHFILTPNNGATYTVEYYRYPRKLPQTPAEDFDLEEDEEVIRAATYYAAANLALLDDEYAYVSLYNDFESRLSRMQRGVAVEVQSVADAYGFHGGGA